ETAGVDSIWLHEQDDGGLEILLLAGMAAVTSQLRLGQIPPSPSPAGGGRTGGGLDQRHPPTRQLQSGNPSIESPTESWQRGRHRELTVDAGAMADAWRRRYQPFLDRVRRGEAPWQVLDELHRASLREVIRELGLEGLSDADVDRLVQAWHHLPPWPDAVDGLTRLRSRFVLTTLSNGGMAMLVDLDRSAELPFDCVLSTELVKSYKPDPRTYQLVSLLAVRPEQAMMVAAHPYDLSAAAEQGMRTAFVRRPQEW